VPLLWLGLSLGCAFAFQERYWRWRDCFNELGRCYDSEGGVMVEQAGWIWGSLAVVFGLMFGRAVCRRMRARKPFP
jgi:hypothetical protein